MGEQGDEHDPPSPLLQSGDARRSGTRAEFCKSSMPGAFVVLPVRIELTTSPLPRGCSTTELRQRRAIAKIAIEASAPILATGVKMAQARVPQRRIIARLFRTLSPLPNIVPMSSGHKSAEKLRRQRRLSAALRENLKRRKAQAKSRAAPSEPAGATSHDSAGIVGKNERER